MLMPLAVVQRKLTTRGAAWLLRDSCTGGSDIMEWRDICSFWFVAPTGRSFTPICQDS